MSGASVQVALPPSVSDENPGDEFAGGLGFDQIWANGPRPGRVSAVEEKKRYDSHTNFDAISVSRVKKIPLEEPTRLSIRVTGSTLSSVTPTHFVLHPTVNHPTHHHISQNIYQALTQIRSSDTVLTKGSKLRSPADLSESQTWKRRGVLGSG